MKNTQLISVIMPCYNSAAFLATSIACVLQQTHAHLELIVVNDGSTDNSLEILQVISDPRLKIVNQENQGVCRARNAALAIAKGDYIAFLDADDTWETDCLEKLYQALQKQSEAVLAYCGWQNLGLPGGQGKPFIPPDYQQLNKQELLFESCRWPIHATLTRNYAITEAGGFDESLLTSEDFLLWIKIGIKYPVCLVPEVLAYYHFHDGLQATKNTQKAAINHWLAQQLYVTENPAFKKQLGRKKIAQLMHGELLRRGYDCYWKRDLQAARAIFKTVMKTGYGSLKDWKYMLPSILPVTLHSKLIDSLSKPL